MSWKKFESTKWQLTVFISLVAAVGLFMDKLSGGEWVSLQSIVTIFYTGANVLSDKLPNKGWKDESRNEERGMEVPKMDIF